MLVADSPPLVYNIVGRALYGHSDVVDVTQETMLRVVRGLPGLNDPGSYRSWMVAIAIRQVRDHAGDRKASTARDSGLDDADAATAFASSSAGTTVVTTRIRAGSGWAV